MKVDQHVIVKLFEKKDRKRRRILYDKFNDYFEPNLSSVFIANMINMDLEVPDLVTVDDIKYCRFYFHGKVKASTRIRSPMATHVKRAEDSKSTVQTVQWSDPDELDTNQSQNIKSKFSK